MFDLGPLFPRARNLINHFAANGHSGRDQFARSLRVRNLTTIFYYFQEMRDNGLSITSSFLIANTIRRHSGVHAKWRLWPGMQLARLYSSRRSVYLRGRRDRFVRACNTKKQGSRRASTSSAGKEVVRNGSIGLCVLFATNCHVIAAGPVSPKTI